MATLEDNREYEPSSRSRRPVDNRPAWMTEREGDRHRERGSYPGPRSRYEDDRRPRGRHVDNRPAWLGEDGNRHRRGDDFDRDSRSRRQGRYDRHRDAYGRDAPPNRDFKRDSLGPGSYLEARLAERLNKPIPNVWARSPSRERGMSDSESDSDVSSGYSSYDSYDSYDSRRRSRRRRSYSRSRSRRRGRSRRRSRSRSRDRYRTRSRSYSRSRSRDRSPSVSSVVSSSTSGSDVSRGSSRRSRTRDREDRNPSRRRSSYASRSRSRDRSSRSGRRDSARRSDRGRYRSRDRGSDRRRYRSRSRSRDRSRDRKEHGRQRHRDRDTLSGPLEPDRDALESHKNTRDLPGPTVVSPSSQGGEKTPANTSTSVAMSEDDEIAAYKRNVLGIDPETDLPLSKPDHKDVDDGGGDSGDDSDDVYGPKLPGEESGEEDSGALQGRAINVSYGKHLLRGEGEAMAAYVQAGERVPRRGEVSWSSEQIEKLEAQGYVMSGSRHKRMNEVRIRKENQVFTAEEKRALALLKAEEREEREQKLLEEFRALVNERQKNA